MKVTDTTTRTLTIEHAAGLDPIDVFIVNYAPGKGRMTIRCWDRAWTCAWFAMRGLSIEEFFVDADPSYILANFSTTGQRVDAIKRDAPYQLRIIGAVQAALRQLVPATSEAGA